MWITQERYPQAHSHNSKNMLSQLEGSKPSGRESNQEIAPSGPADGVHSAQKKAGLKPTGRPGTRILKMLAGN
jgi:hypothetical protein